MSAPSGCLFSSVRVGAVQRNACFDSGYIRRVHQEIDRECRDSMEMKFSQGVQ